MAAYTTIDNPELYFQVKLYTGNSTDDHAITLDGSENMQPDMVWVKGRSNAGYNHNIYDAVRGANKYLRPNSTAAQVTVSDALKSFDSDGFTLDDDATNDEVNDNTIAYVAWCWKESATAGFDIVSFTGNGSARNISHNLSAVPELMLIKKTSGTDAGAVYVAANGNNNGLLISESNANDDELYWNDTTPTSSVFTLGTLSNVNQNTETYIAYVFAPKQGFSKFGTYQGNGNADGQFIYTGFTPELLWIKRSNDVANWVFKTKSSPGYNVNNNYIYGNLANNEASGSAVDFLSNGFKWRIDGANQNSRGDTFIYAAFAKAPIVNSNGVPSNAI